MVPSRHCRKLRFFSLGVETLDACWWTRAVYVPTVHLALFAETCIVILSLFCKSWAKLYSSAGREDISRCSKQPCCYASSHVRRSCSRIQPRGSCLVGCQLSFAK